MSLVLAVFSVSSIEEIRSGACAAWELPVTAECAGQARDLVRDTAWGIGVGGGPVEDAMIMVSELATNALRHGGKRVRRRDGAPVAGLPELWTYLSAPRELVVTVFDAGEGWSDFDVDEADPHGETGRGLQIVAALADGVGGRWGHNLSRSRLGEEPVPGNAVWFTLPLVRNILFEPIKVDPAPAAAISRLENLLRSRGIDHLDHPASATRAGLSVPTGLTVWCQDGVFSWDPPAGGTPEHHPVASVIDVAERVVAAHEALIRQLPCKGR